MRAVPVVLLLAVKRGSKWLDLADHATGDEPPVTTGDTVGK